MGIGLDVSEVAKVLPELTKERPAIEVVEIADHRLDGLGGFIGIVEGNTAVTQKLCC